MPPHVFRAPAKLILSGEHAVLYNHTALTVALDRYCSIQTDTRSRATPCAFLSHIKSVVRSVLGCDLRTDCEINAYSSIPLKSGLGSSAAYTVTLLSALFHHNHLSISDADFLSIARLSENYFHGTSSGIDVTTSFLGGCLSFKDHIFEKKYYESDFNLVHTGAPSSTTRECVHYVQDTFSRDKKLWEDFKDVTDNILNHPHSAIADNHRLLTHLGVVPERVQAFIKTIENHGGRAKICGAGSITGDNAGIVWVYGLEEETVKSLCASYPHFQIFKHKTDTQGLHYYLL